jgi:LPXTG-site transpeptidase (sortase) family protein
MNIFVGKLRQFSISFIGVTLIIGAMAWWGQSYIPRSAIINATQAMVPTPENPEPTTFPEFISISSLKISVPVFASTITNGEWQISNRGAGVVKGNEVNSEADLVFYGHNWPSIFRPLHQVKNGDNIVLDYQDESKNLTKSFVVTKISIVAADDLEALQAPSGSIVIYTCIGLLDRQRFVVWAELVD